MIRIALATTTALGFVALLAAPAIAQAPSPEQARLIEGQIRNWMASTLGPEVKLGDRPAQVMAEGDHYKVLVPITLPNSGPSDPITPTITMHPIDGGRWSIDSFMTPLPLRFTVMMPQPPSEARPGPAGRNGQNGQNGRNGQPGQNGRPGQSAQTTTPTPTAVTYVATAASQSGHGVWDPTFATPSTMETDITGFKMDASGTGFRRSNSFDRSHSVNTLTPAADGRVNVVIDGIIEGYANATQLPDVGEVQVNARTLKVQGMMNAVSRENVVTALQQTIHLLIPVVAAPAKPGVPPPKPDMKATRTLIAAMGDLSSDMAIAESLEDLKVVYAGMGGTAKGARLSMGGKSVQGILQAYMDFGLEGIAVPDLPLGPMLALVPTKVAFRPVISGAATQDVIDMLMAATENPGGPPSAAMARLFTKGGVSTGLESFLIEVGGAAFKGDGSFVMTTPQTGTGKAQIIATGFDSLQAKASAIPQLAQVLPVFVFLKGLGKATGDQLTWDLVYDGSKLLVNGTDMSAMMGGAR